MYCLSIYLGLQKLRGHTDIDIDTYYKYYYSQTLKSLVGNTQLYNSTNIYKIHFQTPLGKSATTLSRALILFVMFTQLKIIKGQIIAKKYVYR